MAVELTGPWLGTCPELVAWGQPLYHSSPPGSAQAQHAVCYLCQGMGVLCKVQALSQPDLHRDCRGCGVLYDQLLKPSRVQWGAGLGSPWSVPAVVCTCSRAGHEPSANVGRTLTGPACWVLSQPGYPVRPLPWPLKCPCAGQEWAVGQRTHTGLSCTMCHLCPAHPSPQGTCGSVPAEPGHKTQCLFSGSCRLC